MEIDSQLVYCLEPPNDNLCFYVGTENYTTYFSRLINNENNNEIGEFTMSGIFDSGNTVDMSISIEEEYQGQGISRELVRLLCYYIMEYAYPNIRKDQLLFIDSDASAGFWDHIGMKENPYGIDYVGNRDLEGRGYEKLITFGDLCIWARAHLPVNGGKKNKRKTNKSKKHKKHSKTNKSKKHKKHSKTNKSKKHKKYSTTNKSKKQSKSKKHKKHSRKQK